MDKLKALVSAKRKTTEEEFGGKKFMKRGDLEEIRLKKLREEEAQENAAKRQRGGHAAVEQPDTTEQNNRPGSRQDSGAAVVVAAEQEPPQPPALSREEVMRRLRVLKQPVTLFGEDGPQRYARLLSAERSMQVEDEAAGGQQENLHIALERQKKENARLKPLDASAEPSRPPTSASDEAPGDEAAAAAAAASTAGEAALDDEQARLMASFQAAADAVAEQNLPMEDRIAMWLQRWMRDWEEDLEARDPSVKGSAAGRQADVRFKETEQYMRPLYFRLRQRSLDVQLLAGIKLIVDAMRERNYLHAYKIYMGVAIGNSPWPIGVTQVGLHERSAREKISFKYSTGSAHIMNDEATRKFIQALKRIMTFCQRRYPTDPSRSVDFDGFVHEGKGAAGGGSDKLALLAAVHRGEDVAPAPAPSHVDARGKVKIPEKWDQMLKGALKEVAASDAAEDAAAAAAAGARGGKS